MNEWYSSNYEILSYTSFECFYCFLFWQDSGLLQFCVIWSSTVQFVVDLLQIFKILLLFLWKTSKCEFFFRSRNNEWYSWNYGVSNVQFGMFLLFRILNTLGYSSGLLRFPKMLHSLALISWRLWDLFPFGENRKKRGTFLGASVSRSSGSPNGYVPALCGSLI